MQNSLPLATYFDTTEISPRFQLTVGTPVSAFGAFGPSVDIPSYKLFTAQSFALSI